MSDPKFEQLWKNYPKGSPDDVKKDIGGRVNLGWIKNTCVIRMSRAFNKSGQDIKVTAELHTVEGGDKKRYAYRVREFVKYLKKELGEPSKVLTPPDRAKLVGKRGILVFEVDAWSNATGHATLWNGRQCVDDDCYWSKARSVLFWELQP